ncbi:MAG TPA: anthranilate synthase component I [Rhizomicrobium sp.]|nr:anthranilate synthase component I [Rhizomicrobium sp.]
MDIEPDFAVFEGNYREGRSQVVFTRRIADLDTPVSAYLKLAQGRDNTFLLESVQGGETRGRYSVIGIEPDLVWQCRGGRAEISQPGQAGIGPAPSPDRPLESLRQLVSGIRMDLPRALPPMSAGLFGYLGYDMVRLVERLGPAPPDTLNLPDAIMLRPTITAVFDNIRDEILVVTPVWPRPDIDAASAWRMAADRLARACSRLDAPVAPTSPNENAYPSAPIESNMSRAEYLAIVDRAKAYIYAGDIFQVVPSQRFRRAFPLPPFALYRALRRLNPSPFLYHLAFPGFAIVGSSPEILVRLRDGTVTMRPIAGTRRRGTTPDEDTKLAEDLLADPKERAEHLMLLDLGRNDVGRISKIGSVRVTDSFFVERYSHVMHLVSNVEGRIRDNCDAIDALTAGLPAGTLTGAPKIRAMEIIDEFEKEKRGAVYAGAVGYFAANGAMDTCIVLRTAVVKDGMMYVQAGGGVVADSIPESEFQETVNKAQALFSAADEAVRFATKPSAAPGER